MKKPNKKQKIQYFTIKRTKSQPTYTTWQAMKKRCYYTKHHSYKNYGGRGIVVCDRWKDSYENFLTDMGERPSGTTINRINNDGNYEPSNCEWATDKVQSLNKRKQVS